MPNPALFSFDFKRLIMGVNKKLLKLNFYSPFQIRNILVLINSNESLL